MDEHAEALAWLENRVAALMSGSGPDIDSYRPSLPPPPTANRTVVRGKVQADIMIAAPQAGLTNVGVLQFRVTTRAPRSGDGTTFKDTLHSSAHNNPTDPQRLMR